MPGPMRHAKIAAVLALAATLLPSQTATRPDTKPSIPSPAEFLGRPLGETYSRHCEIVDYARRVAAASPRVRLTTYGRTLGRARAVLLAVTSPENHARRSRARGAVRKLADPRKLAPGEDIEEARRRSPGGRLALLQRPRERGFAVASARSRCSTGSRRRTDAETTHWLSEAIVLSTPASTPTAATATSTGSRRGRPPAPIRIPTRASTTSRGPAAATNHFQFDLNRDWAFATPGRDARRALAALRRDGRRRSTSTSTRCPRSRPTSSSRPRSRSTRTSRRTP